MLTDEQVTFFREHGYLVVRDFFAPALANSFSQWVDELKDLPLNPGAQMVYLEENPQLQGVVSRIEKITDVHSGWGELLNNGKVVGCVEQLFGEAVNLFKEKINFQAPFGGGIAPHQDIQAGWLKYAKDFISVSIPVDVSNIQNGCTEIDVNWSNKGLIGDEWIPLSDSQMGEIDFRPVETKPGDVVFFDAYIPHQAPVNPSGNQRRILFATYNPVSQGDHREEYYQDKRASFPPDNERTGNKEYHFKV